MAPPDNRFLFDEPLERLDPEVADLVRAEGDRQAGKLILIASESLCPKPVAEALISPFSALYAEGYPSSRMMGWERGLVGDHERHLAFNRRYADRRYYKGCEYANFIEVLAQKRAADVFATTAVPEHELHVNVQPLSGSAANNAIYQAFVQPGDLVMGMALPHGGHLTHGSELNRSGKLYRILPYLVDTQTGRLDYDAIISAARDHQPRMLIAGGSAYPWELDWAALREAADQVRAGCTLLADISHPAGLVAAGEFPSPVGYADVISMTTHKTLCGPRGAIIVTTDRRRAAAIDLAVFPGEQGGPHVHQIAAKAVAFGLAGSGTFRALMRQVRANADALCKGLLGAGLRIQGGGTASHLLLLDLKGCRKSSGVPLYGDIASNLLDLCGITANKNTIAGDVSAFHPSGLRLGTTVLSQQGYDEPAMHRIAALIHRVVDAARTFTVTTAGGERGRARIAREVLEEVRAEVAELTGTTWPDSVAPAGDDGLAVLELRGERAGVFLQGVAAADVLTLAPGASKRTVLLDARGDVFAEVQIARGERSPGSPAWTISCAAAGVHAVEDWLRGLSDGYLDLDPDLTRKVDGPAAIRRGAVRPASAGDPPPPAAAAGRPSGRAAAGQAPEWFSGTKPWFIGRHALGAALPSGAPLPRWTWRPPEGQALRRTALNAIHREATAGHNMVPFAGWDMPVLYTSIRDEHTAVRTAAGLFDVSHMGPFEVRGRDAIRFLDLVTTNFAWRLRPGLSQYSYILRPDGTVLDDLLIYMLAVDRIMVVANASNADEVIAWLQAVAAGEARISEKDPGLRPDTPDVRVVNLRDRDQAGDGMRVNVSLQGPRSVEILQAFAGDDRAAAEAVTGLEKSELVEVRLGAFELVVSRTGYTGEEWGYELFVHPDRLPDLWNALLETGALFGLAPCGLGARDSLRAEAGFPLHGHELEGPAGVVPGEAGYAAFVKEHKSFFVGRERHLERARGSRRAVARLLMERAGIRMVQPGDVVANARGQTVGRVTSAVLPGARQVLLALVDRASARPGTRLAVFSAPRKNPDAAFKAIPTLEPGDAVALSEPAIVMDRFPVHGCGDTSCAS